MAWSWDDESSSLASAGVIGGGSKKTYGAAPVLAEQAQQAGQLLDDGEEKKKPDIASSLMPALAQMASRGAIGGAAGAATTPNAYEGAMPLSSMTGLAQTLTSNPDNPYPGALPNSTLASVTGGQQSAAPTLSAIGSSMGSSLGNYSGGVIEKPQSTFAENINKPLIPGQLNNISKGEFASLMGIMANAISPDSIGGRMGKGLAAFATGVQNRDYKQQMLNLNSARLQNQMDMQTLRLGMWESSLGLKEQKLADQTADKERKLAKENEIHSLAGQMSTIPYGSPAYMGLRKKLIEAGGDPYAYEKSNPDAIRSLNEARQTKPTLREFTEGDKKIMKEFRGYDEQGHQVWEPVQGTQGGARFKPGSGTKSDLFNHKEAAKAWSSAQSNYTKQDASIVKWQQAEYDKIDKDKQGDKETRKSAIAKIAQAQQEANKQRYVGAIRGIRMEGAPNGLMDTNVESGAQPPSASNRTVVQTGTEKGTGKKVVRYSDGSVEYAQ